MFSICITNSQICHQLYDYVLEKNVYLLKNVQDKMIAENLKFIYTKT
jgi:hypothetical protein